MPADDALPDSLEPGQHVPPRDQPPAPPTPRGDLRVVSILAVITGVIVVGWHIFLVSVSAVAELDQFLWIQIGIWALALVSFVLGILSLNARMARELAAAGFIAGVAAFLLSISIGLFSGALFLS
ncbi:hypothetical protein ACF044_07645 [Microbacterium sp. NPDC016588]|uniref:hypothetical protein n=1 Tax=Microbacterium TaxID=33882 RepID=UPI00097BDEDC|nr:MULTISPECIES: hypothetical protein [Microbacterium]MDI9892561.1 hypothetical protein [Microbacterium sp. IEGM 1404]MXS75655.1 hypothetical protein [Microbacterium sp. TL13]ONI64759.1 hypothetical protein CSIV_08510 [Microbacterium sp. CSI-V]